MFIPPETIKKIVVGSFSYDNVANLREWTILQTAIADYWTKHGKFVHHHELIVSLCDTVNNYAYHLSIMIFQTTFHNDIQLKPVIVQPPLAETDSLRGVFFFTKDFKILIVSSMFSIQQLFYKLYGNLLSLVLSYHNMKWILV